MEKQKYLDDLQEIRSIMDRSSRFISLSGISGIAAGVVALAGAFFAYQKVYSVQNLTTGSSVGESSMTLVVIALGTLVTALLAALYFTRQKARKNRQGLWDAQAKRMVINLFIPLVAGGVLCLIFLAKGLLALLAPLTLVFYGLGLVNASKYTFSEIRSLGLIEVALGLTACWFSEWGLLLWALGFGVFHIIYGIAMHLRYGS